MTPAELGKNSVLIRRYIVNIRKKKGKKKKKNMEKEMITHSCLGNPRDTGAWQDTVQGVTESVTTEHACMADSLRCTGETNTTL